MSDETGSPEKIRARALELALARLSRKESSTQDLRRYLEQKGFGPELPLQIVEELQARGLLDDRRYASLLSRAQMLRGKGPRYIQAKLREKGIRAEVSAIRRGLEESSGFDELAEARKVLEKRYPRYAEDPQVARRAYQALLRRGYSAQVAGQAIRQGSGAGSPGTGSKDWETSESS